MSSQNYKRIRPSYGLARDEPPRHSDRLSGLDRQSYYEKGMFNAQLKDWIFDENPEESKRSRAAASDPPKPKSEWWTSRSPQKQFEYRESQLDKADQEEYGKYQRNQHGLQMKESNDRAQAVLANDRLIAASTAAIEAMMLAPQPQQHLPIHDAAPPPPRRSLQPLPPITLHPRWYNPNFKTYNLTFYRDRIQGVLNHLGTPVNYDYVFRPEQNFYPDLSRDERHAKFDNEFYEKLYNHADRFHFEADIEIGDWKRCFSLYYMKYYFYNIRTGEVVLDGYINTSGQPTTKNLLYRADGDGIQVWDWDPHSRQMVLRNISIIDDWKDKYLLKRVS